MAIRETELEKRFHKICKRNRVKTIKVDPDRYNGIPDRIVFNPVRHFIHYVEFKNNTYYERSRNQIWWGNFIVECGGTYFLLDGDDEVDEYVKEYIEGEKK